MMDRLTPRTKAWLATAGVRNVRNVRLGLGRIVGLPDRDDREDDERK